MGWVSNWVARRRARPQGTAARPLAPAPASPPTPPRRPSSVVATFSQVVARVAGPALPRCAPAVIADAADRVLERCERERQGLGSFPDMATRIMDILAVPDPDFNRLVQALGHDMAITAKLLQVANSALYSRGESVENVRAAVIKIGLREVGQLAIGLAGRSLFETTSRAEHSLFPKIWDRLFHDSMTSAFSSGRLSLSARVGRSDSAFLVGMLHDIGKPIALRSLAALMLEGKLDRNVLDGGIEAVIEQVHVQVGTVVTAEWSLPGYLRAAAAHHHDVEVGPDVPDEVHIVRVVDGIRALRAGEISEAQRSVLRSSAAVLRLDHRMMRVCSTEQAELAQRVTEIFGVADPLASR
jgi:HD-like signal output (HDOD) protein